MRTKAWTVLTVLMFLATQAVRAGGACTAARVHDSQDGGCNANFAGAGGVAPAHCPTCTGMPRWWVSEPYISLQMADTPLSYTLSSGQPMDFTFHYNQRVSLPEPDESIISAANVLATGSQYQHGANCGTGAYWGLNWNSSVVLKPLFSQTDLTFNGGYCALVFHPEGNVDVYTNLPGLISKNPQTQVVLTDNSGGAGYPKVAAWDYPLDGLTTNLPTADANGIYWGDTNVGVKLQYPDGSQDIFALSGCTIYTSFPLRPTSSYGTRMLLTQRIDPQGRVTKLGYQQYSPYLSGAYLFRAKYVVDIDGRTNTFQYNGNTNNQLLEIDDPFGRKTTLTYNGDGTLNRIVDAIGLTNSFQYPPAQVSETTYYASETNDTVLFTEYTTNFSDGWISQLNTKYGTNQFLYYEVDDSTVIDGVQQRALFVNEPEGAQELYYYLHKGGALIPATATAPTVPGITNFDDGIAGGISGHNALSYRNTFHWGRRQFPALASNGSVMSALFNALWYQNSLPGYSQSQFATALSALGSSDFSKADLKHWLWQGDNISLSSSVSSDRAPSFDAAGQNSGLRTWYNYLDKPADGAEDLGDNPQIACVAQTLPNGTNQYTTYNFYPSFEAGAALASDNETTFTKPDGTVGVLTNWFGYANNSVDLLSFSNSAGQFVNYGYNNVHQVIALTNALNQVTTFTWNPNLTGIQMPSGKSINLGYYASAIPPTGTSSMLQWVTTQPESRAFTNNSYYAGLPTSVTDDRGVTVANTWDNLNRLTSTVFPDGTSSSNVYNRLDLAGTKDRLGNWTDYAYDGLQHLTNVVNANNAVTRYTWCGCGSLSEIIDAQNGTANPTYLSYDNQGNLTNVIYPDNSSLKYQFDLAARITNVIDGAGRTLQIGYNSQSLPTAVTGASGRLRQTAYDALNRPVNVTDANGVTVTNQYDSLGELVKRTWPDGISENYGYGAAGPMTYTNRDGKVTFYGRDGAGRLTGVTNANQEVTRFAYDSLDNVTTLWDGNTNQTRWQYNQYGWLTNKVDGLGRNVFRCVYNANGWVTNRWTPEKGNTVYGYDNVGNLKSIAYPQQTNSYAYDALNRLTNTIDAVGSTTFGYTPAGQLQTENGPWASDLVACAYAQGMRTNLSLTQVSGTWSEAYGYDANWRLQTLTSPAGSFGYSYNYQPASALVTAIALPNAASITNGYDALGRMRATVLNNFWGHTLDGSAYTPDASGLRTNLVRNLGLTTSSVNVGYDNIGQLTSWNAAEAGGALRQNEQLNFVFDAAHNLHGRINGALAQSFITDAANELTNVTRTGTFTMSGATTTPVSGLTVNGLPAQMNGDLTFARTNFTLASGNNTFTNVAQNAYGLRATNLLTLNLPQSVALGFDNNGNLTNDGVRTFGYDAENQLTNVTVVNSWKSDFVYDGLNRRRIERDYGWSSGTWTKTNEVHYIYDGRLLLQERDVNNNVLVTYTRGLDLSDSLGKAGGIGGLLARTDGNGSTFYHADANGNITALMDGNENMVARYLYNPFGKLLGQWGSLATANEIQFSSMPQRDGLSFFPFRAYEPNFQRWLTHDPIAENGGINLYAFTYNNAQRYVDPLGFAGAEDTEGDLPESERTPDEQFDDALKDNQVLGAQTPQFNPIPPEPGNESEADFEANNAKVAKEIADNYLPTEPTSASTSCPKTYQATPWEGPGGDAFGSASGEGTPEDNVARRDDKHDSLNGQNYKPVQFNGPGSTSGATGGK